MRKIGKDLYQDDFFCVLTVDCLIKSTPYNYIVMCHNAFFEVYISVTFYFSHSQTISGMLLTRLLHMYSTRHVVRAQL